MRGRGTSDCEVFEIECARASPCFSLANRRLDDPHLREYAEVLSILFTYFWKFIRHDLGPGRHRVLSVVCGSSVQVDREFSLGGASCDRLPLPAGVLNKSIKPPAAF